MSRSSRPRFDLRPLAHPLWWLALAVLLVNDNLLKGRGLVPGWLTGKLSDFAFLVVAPVLLGCLLPVALRGRKVIALAAVAAIYTATELSPTASDAVVAAAAWMGLRWRLWPDVTDLMALVVLPLAWRLLDRPSERAAILRPVGVLLGLFACLATTDDFPIQFPFLVNRSDGPVDVRLTWVQRNPICRLSLQQLASNLSPPDLTSPDPFSLARGDVAALDAPAPDGTSSAHRCENVGAFGRECSTFLVDIAGGPAVLARATGAPKRPRQLCHQPVPPDAVLDHGALSITGSRGSWRFVTTPEIEIFEINRADIDARGSGPQTCQGLLASLKAVVASPSPCAVDADCHLHEVPWPAQRSDRPCAVYVDPERAARIEGLAQGLDACFSRPIGTECPARAQPPLCQAGSCAEACPGEACIHPCEPGEAARLYCPREGDLCRPSADQLCRCQGNLWRCDQASKVATCLIDCLIAGPPLPPDGGQQVRPDAGADGKGR